MPDRKPERMPDRMPNRMPERMSNRMSETECQSQVRILDGTSIRMPKKMPDQNAK